MRKVYIVAGLFIALLIASLATGVASIGLADAFDPTAAGYDAFWKSRVPRTVSIVLAGAGMSIAGMIMQQLSQNRFVSPTTAGTLDAVRLGILLSMLLFTSAPLVWKFAFALAFAFGSSFLFLHILQRIPFREPVFIPLVGLMFGNILSSIAVFLAYRANLLQSLSSWLQGDFSMVLQGTYELLYVSIPAVILAYLFADAFTIAGMGEEFAKGLGLRYRHVVNIGLLIVSVITVTVVLTAGMLPFLGLIVPNIASMMRGDRIRSTLPLTALLGASLVLACDVLGRLLIYPYEIPISVMLGVIGSAVFLALLFRARAYA